MNTSPSKDGAKGQAELRYDVRDILKGSKEATIVHDGEEYRLRITGNGRLILTK